MKNASFSGGAHVRWLASEVIAKVLAGRSLSAELATVSMHRNLPARDWALLQSLCYGVCRFFPRLHELLVSLLKKPLKDNETMLYALLLIGLYQLSAMRVPAFAAVAETVEAAKGLNKKWAPGLVNALLRTFLRQRKTLEGRLHAILEARYAHPKWWASALQDAWPLHWEAILAANNAPPPFSLRVNLKAMSREEMMVRLDGMGLGASPLSYTDGGIVLGHAVSTETLPGFSSGLLSVQDGAAQLAASLMGLSPGQRVLDACAAPGGKLVHMLEISEKASSDFIAVEKDPARMALLYAALKRSNVVSQAVCHDVAEVMGWWDGKCFDRILLDAPCTGSGVVRRHPDIKLLRRPTDVYAHAKKQRQLLSALWPLLKSGGLLLYSTCSLFPSENVGVLKPFLLERRDAFEQKIEAKWGVPCEVGRQILPGMHKMDGFYYAKICKSHSERM